jgi:AraC family ethanolamine operon transcriptional activator
MKHYKTVILAPVVHRNLRHLIELPAWRGADLPHPFHADLMEAQLTECLSPESSICLQPVRKTHHSDLVRELVRFSFQSSTEPICLSAICKALFTTKTTLTVSCREMFGYGPMALLRRIRLQQVHEVLSNSGLRQQLGCHTVHQAAEYFGFASRNHFAGAYRDLFTVTPGTSLLASR